MRSSYASGCGVTGPPDDRQFVDSEEERVALERNLFRVHRESQRVGMSL
jgi:hypothetical protein